MTCRHRSRRARLLLPCPDGGRNQAVPHKWSSLLHCCVARLSTCDKCVTTQRGAQVRKAPVRDRIGQLSLRGHAGVHTRCVASPCPPACVALLVHLLVVVLASHCVTRCAALLDRVALCTFASRTDMQLLAWNFADATGTCRMMTRLTLRTRKSWN